MYIFPLLLLAIFVSFLYYILYLICVEEVERKDDNGHKKEEDTEKMTFTYEETNILIVLDTLRTTTQRNCKRIQNCNFYGQMNNVVYVSCVLMRASRDFWTFFFFSFSSLHMRGWSKTSFAKLKLILIFNNFCERKGRNFEQSWVKFLFSSIYLRLVEISLEQP